MLAGNSTFTVQNPETDMRYTFKVVQPHPTRPHFVKLLTMPDHFFPIATIFNHKTLRLAKFRRETAAYKAFAWLWRNADDLPAPAEFYHEGRCGKCGRKLTVPESIKSGIGPVCAERKLR